MLDEHFSGVLRLELPDVARVPQLACYSEVLAAAHHGIRFAALGCGRNAVRGEIGLLATSDGYQSGVQNQRFSSLRLDRDMRATFHERVMRILG